MPGDPDPSGELRPWNVFLSSTIKDFETFRAEVSRDLHRYAEAACFLSEDWVGGFDDTIAKCERRVRQSDAFILLLGYWYGSIPPGSTRSVTHIEFDTAQARWKEEAFPPVAVMRPKDDSDAHTKLSTLADQILRTHAAEPTFDRALHDERRQDFRRQVVNSWRTVNEFSTCEELTKQAITCVLRWQGKSPANAATGKVKVDDKERVSELSDAALGSLGRDAHLRRSTEMVSLAAAEPAVPGLALIVHGPEDAGHAEFLAALSRAEPALAHCRVGTLPTRQSSIAALTAWVGQACGLSQRDALTTPEALAERLCPELKRTPLAFVLARIGLLAGGLQAFTDGFWTPLYRRLEQLAAGQAFQHKLTVIVGSVTGDANAVDAATNPLPSDEDLPDYSRPLRLPALGSISRPQLVTWLRERGVEAARLNGLADSVLKDDNGNDDRVPTRVFRRLQEQWSE